MASGNFRLDLDKFRVAMLVYDMPGHDYRWYGLSKAEIGPIVRAGLVATDTREGLGNLRATDKLVSVIKKLGADRIPCAYRDSQYNEMVSRIMTSTYYGRGIK